MDHDQSIDSRISELEASLDQCRQDVAEAHSELDSFIYTVSHDFRALLRAIMSSSMILIEDYAENLDAEGKAELERQSTAARKLSALLDELLKLSRLSRQDLAPETLSLADIAVKAASDVHVPSDSLHVQESTTIFGDPLLLRLALSLLIQNSARFSRKDVPLRIEVGQERGRYFVRDNGIGFDVERAGKIFLPFETLHGGSDGPGLGMGLAFVKRIIERHGGRISAEAAPNEGATFWFSVREP